MKQMQSQQAMQEQENSAFQDYFNSNQHQQEGYEPFYQQPSSMNLMAKPFVPSQQPLNQSSQSLQQASGPDQQRRLDALKARLLKQQYQEMYADADAQYSSHFSQGFGKGNDSYQMGM
jgi:hypothetical protein